MLFVTHGFLGVTFCDPNPHLCSGHGHQAGCRRSHTRGQRRGSHRFRRSQFFGSGQQPPRGYVGGWAYGFIVAENPHLVSIVLPRSLTTSLPLKKRWLEDDPFLLGFGLFLGAMSVTPIYEPWKGHLEGVPQPQLGDLRSPWLLTTY